MSKHFESLKIGIGNLLKKEQNVAASLIFYIPLIMFNPKKINEKLTLLAKDTDDLYLTAGEFQFEHPEAWISISNVQMNANKLYRYNIDVQQKISGRRVWLNYYSGKFTFGGLKGTPDDFIKVIEHIKFLMNFI